MPPSPTSRPSILHKKLRGRASLPGRDIASPSAPLPLSSFFSLLSWNFVSAKDGRKEGDGPRTYHMKRANIGCLDNRDRISDGKTFIKKGESGVGRRARDPSPCVCGNFARDLLVVTVACVLSWARPCELISIMPEKSNKLLRNLPLFAEQNRKFFPLLWFFQIYLKLYHLLTWPTWPPPARSNGA